MTLEGFADVSDILRCGVYALVAKGRVIYIGKSKKMISRIDKHRQVWGQKRQGKSSWLAETLGIPGIMFDEVHVAPCRPDQVDELEQAMIRRYQPQYNIHHKRRGVMPEVLVYNGIEISLVPPARPQVEFVRRV